MKNNNILKYILRLLSDTSNRVLLNKLSFLFKIEYNGIFEYSKLFKYIII